MTSGGTSTSSRSGWSRKKRRAPGTGCSFYGDFRVRYAYEYWKLPAQSNFPTFTDMVKLGNPADAIGTIQEIIGFLFDNQLPLRSRDPFTLANDQSFQLRFRLKMKAEVTKDIHFAGRLKVLSEYGSGGIVDPIFNGSPNTVFYGFNAANTPSDTVVRLERAYVTWNINKTPLILTIGRQAATEGPPRHQREDRVRQGTPPAILIDAEVDGVMLGWKMKETFPSLPPTTVRVCYGLGYEAGFGGGGRVQKSTVNTGMFRLGRRGGHEGHDGPGRVRRHAAALPVGQDPPEPRILPRNEHHRHRRRDYRELPGPVGFESTEGHGHGQPRRHRPARVCLDVPELRDRLVRLLRDEHVPPERKTVQVRFRVPGQQRSPLCTATRKRP